MVGADFDKNHEEGSSGNEGSGNILRKSGDVLEASGPDWAKATADSTFPSKS